MWAAARGKEPHERRRTRYLDETDADTGCPNGAWFGTGDRRKSTPVAYGFAGRLRVEGGERHSLSQWLHHRSSGIERVEKQTKRSLACVPIVRLHPVPSQPVTGGPNNGEAQHQ